MIVNSRFSAAVLGLLLAAAACNNDELNRPFAVTPVDPMFNRYVSMGNSITAGFQSGGINDSTQSQSYAVLLARAMHTPFFSPLMNKPGCPPPYTNVFTAARLSGGTPTTCALRKTQAVTPPFISNVAVPGALVNDIYTNGADVHSNTLTQFFLGGLTQVQMARRVEPTFVSVWIGNNDVLGAATNSTNGGDTTLVTPAALFNARYDSLIDSVDAVGADGGILVGVANVTAVPYFSQGSTYWAIKNGLVVGAPALPALFTVSNNCALISSGIPGARGDSVLVPFPYGAGLIGAAQAGAARNLDCADTVAAVVVPAELRYLVAAVNSFNTHISAAAAAQGWAYLNPNTALDSLHTVAAAVRPFPLIGQPCSANPFGTAFSCDAVHPSAATHRLIAQKLRDAINAAYATAIPAIP